MRSIIEELWYSNICRSDQADRDDPAGKELLNLIATNRKKLCEGLTAVQKERLECYDDCVAELNGLDERDAFAFGFCLGLRLAAEAFCGL